MVKPTTRLIEAGERIAILAVVLTALVAAYRWR
jgi:hypothetical protein